MKPNRIPPIIAGGITVIIFVLFVFIILLSDPSSFFRLLGF